MAKQVVYRAKVDVEETVVGVQCNVCGTVRTEDEYGKYEFRENVHSIVVAGGWGDRYPTDLETIGFDVCGDCLRAWTSTFKVPPSSTHMSAREAYSAIHSEDGSTWIVDGCWARPEGTDFSEPCSEWDNHDPVPGLGVWRHFKGRLYEVVNHTRSAIAPYEYLVVYRALYDDSKTFVRPLSMWSEEVPSTEEPGRLVRRFEPYCWR